MDPLTIYGGLMTLLLVVNLIVTYLLVRGVRDSSQNVAALNERAFISVTKTVAVSLLTIISFNRAFALGWPPEFTVGLLVIATLITSASPIGWLWLYVTHRFGPEAINTNDIVLFKDREDGPR
jgi:hypothetical protein